MQLASADFDALQALITDEDLSIFESHSGDGLMKIEPIFFYHTFKAGGNSLLSIVRGSYVCYAALADHATDQIYNRFDSMLPGQYQNLPYMLLASHCPYGFHKQFTKRSYKLMACLRDPLKRVQSAYGYEMMRQDWQPEKEDFIDFFTDPATQNITTKQFAGYDVNAPEIDDISDETLLEMAKNHLSQFDYITILEDLKSMVEGFLGKRALSNIVMSKLNVTLPPYRPKFPELDAQIKALNQADIALYEHIKTSLVSSEIAPPKIDRALSLNPFTTFCFDEQSNEGSFSKTIIAHEKTLHDALNSGNKYASLRDFCVEEIAPRNQEKGPTLFENP